MPPEESKRTLKDEIRETLRVIIISLAIVIPVRMFVAQPFIVRGASMEPNFHDGEYLVVDELSYRVKNPARGEVIVMRPPKSPREFYIKRVVGLPGEVVEIENGRVTTTTQSGERLMLDESYLPKGLLTGPNVRLKLRDGEYFVMGDNRNNSLDSRSWGPLPEDNIVGRAFVRLWPMTRISIF